VIRDARQWSGSSRHPTEAAVEAMALWQTGRTQDARTRLIELCHLMNDPQWNTNRLMQWLLEMARELVRE
jgi:uncharacterized protein YjgD (DUF1641 family)